MQNNGYQLNIIVRNKKTGKHTSISEYSHEGKAFIEGRKGSEFELEFVNNTPNKVLIIPSVDGVSTLKSEVATPDSPGLVVRGYQTVRIPGWKYTSEDAGRFMFKDKEASYGAAQTGSARNVGVIGVLVFEEKVRVKIVEKPVYVPTPYPVPQPYPVYPRPPFYPYQPRCSTTFGASGATNDVVYRNAGSLGSIGGSVTNTMGTNSAVNNMNAARDSIRTKSAVKGVEETLNLKKVAVASSAVASASVNSVEVADSTQLFDLGVGWGEKTEFKTVSTTFERGNSVAQLVIYYDSRKNLEKRGIQLYRRESESKIQELPMPFQGACVPPPGWKG